MGMFFGMNRKSRQSVWRCIWKMCLIQLRSDGGSSFKWSKDGPIGRGGDSSSAGVWHEGHGVQFGVGTRKAGFRR